jgi:hypothetical protein
MRFEAANLSSLVTATIGAPLAAIRAPATERCALRELGIALIAATQSLFELRRATTVSVTPGTTVAGLNKTPGAPASGTLLVASWGTAPVVAGTALRNCVLPASVGGGIIWTWPPDDPLIVGLGSAIAELVICNSVAVAPSAFRYYAIWED